MAEATDFCAGDMLQESGALSWHVIASGYMLNDRDLVSIDTQVGTGSVFEVLLNSEFDHYDLDWSVTDNCQNSTTAHSIVYLRDRAVAAPICLGSISVGNIDPEGITLHPEELAISTIMDCDEVDILGLSLDSADQSIVDKLHLSCNQLSMSDSLNLRLWSVDRFGNRNFCRVTVRYRLDNGCTAAAVSLSGTVSTIFNEPMPNVEVGLFGTNQQMMSSDVTDDQGGYLFDPMIDQSEYLKAAKDNSSFAGITTLDIILLQQYVLGLIDIQNPYLLWAGDINQDGRISAIDITLLRSALLGVNEDNGVGDWIFFDADMVVSPTRAIESSSAIIDISDISSIDNTLDLLGMKYGDVSGDSYLAGQRSIKDDIQILYAAKQSNNTDNQKIELQIDHDEGISGFDIQLDVGLKGDIKIFSDDISIRSSDYARSDDGVRLIWVNSDNSNSESIVLSVVFDSKENAVFEPQLISGSVWSNSLEEYQSVLTDESHVVMPEVSVYPNPFRHRANLTISGITEQDVDLTIYDGVGRLVKNYQKVSVTSGSIFVIDDSELGGRGIYYYVMNGHTISLRGSFIVL